MIDLEMLIGMCINYNQRYGRCIFVMNNNYFVLCAVADDCHVLLLLLKFRYYGYRGSFTVPPCSETVYWRFLDFPAHISWKQYNRMKALITNQLDDNCQRSSIAHNGGINRPVQRFRGDVWRCKGWKVKYEEDWENMWPESYHAMKSGKLD